MNIEDNEKNLTWWWEKLELSQDWNTMPIGMRKDLVKKLRAAFIDLAEVNITETDITQLIVLTDIATVWDSLLSLVKMPKENKTRWGILAYLKTIVINKWKEKHMPTGMKQPPPEFIKVKKKERASLEVVNKYNPLNFKRRCSVCRGVIRKDNTSGICRTCGHD